MLLTMEVILPANFQYFNHAMQVLSQIRTFVVATQQNLAIRLFNMTQASCVCFSLKMRLH